MAADSRLVAIGLACTAFALFASMSALAKHLGEVFTTVQIVFFRSVFALLPLVVLIHGTGLADILRVERPWLLALRCLVGLLAMLLFFGAVTVLPLAEVVALAFAAPIFTTIFGRFLLREQVGLHRWAAVIVGLVGVMIMVRPGTAMFSPWSLLPLGSALFYSLGVILVRTLSRTETAPSMVLYFSLFAATVTGLGVSIDWRTPGVMELVLLVLMGLFGGVMQLCSISALKRAEVTVLAPFEYTSLLWSTLLGYAFWNEFPGNHLWLGAALVCGSALYIVYREARARAG
ncbi:MAG: DMT family transporter [Pseudomonadota bacterium]